MTAETPSTAHHSPNHSTLYATPRIVTNLDECYFYHTMEIPGYGLVQGEWDLRHGMREYLGGVDFSNKRVLEIGTASGFLCFQMERLGAEVIAYDLSEHQSWDIVPFVRANCEEFARHFKTHIHKINNGYWLAHQAHQSNAKVLYGSVYEIPEAIGAVDISTFCSVLLHVRDPFLALQKALRLTRETVIITERLPKYFPLVSLLAKLGKSPMIFLPNFKTREPQEAWWYLPPETIQQFIGVLGFEKSKVTYHRQTYRGQKTLMYTVIGHRE
ncbi:class I SAM-dependent methyltransferase [Phormidium sp. CCY1219]|uniref:class I SAM-dependent methyltransferase n=1 Tax=Phormidium sp. CCY1219 TaxID=2886104 RepID=UPI002D1F0F98|nr:methyltransferase domain-containing protein [Phormidium sp. CCY1219]MEB3829893.1 class I SAM-dependent methyltransferase [Phormidium sp. CCY1219]